MTTLSVGKVVSLSTNGVESAPSRELTGPDRGRIAGEDLVRAAERAQRMLQDAEAAGAACLLAFEQQVDHLRSKMREELAAELAHEHTAKLLELAALRARAVRQAQDDIVQLARLLAERVLGEELTLHPERVVALARQAIREAAGARRITLHAAPRTAEQLQSDVNRLAVVTDAATLEIAADPDLQPGDLRVVTDIGIIDARVGTQLAHLAETLVESIRS